MILARNDGFDVLRLALQIQTIFSASIQGRSRAGVKIGSANRAPELETLQGNQHALFAEATEIRMSDDLSRSDEASTGERGEIGVGAAEQHADALAAGRLTGAADERRVGRRPAGFGDDVEIAP
jgi:hypothetical protein